MAPPSMDPAVAGAVVALLVIMALMPILLMKVLLGGLGLPLDAILLLGLLGERPLGESRFKLPERREVREIDMSEL